MDDLESLFRCLRLREFFIDEEEEEENHVDILFNSPTHGCHQKLETLPSEHTSGKLEQTWNAN